MNNQKELNKHLVSQVEQLENHLKEAKQSFEIEKNIKNGLYFFILENGLFEKLKKFEPFVNYQKTNFHNKALNWLIDNLPNN